MAIENVLTVFTKPWKTQSIEEVGELASNLGFDGIELPVRPGFQVEPENVGRDLPLAAKALEAYGVKIVSVAGPVDEPTVVACGKAGVPIIRTMARVMAGESYTEAEARIQSEYDAIVPACETHGVTIGVQNHLGRFVANAVGLRHLIGKYDPRHVAAVWDAAHEAVNGSEPDLALDVVWPMLCMVNLKNAIWRQVNGPEAEVAEWKLHWTDGPHGLADWPRVVALLQERGYKGPICLTAEYSDENAVERLIASDMAFFRSLTA